jgi:hypothetical protein
LNLFQPNAHRLIREHGGTWTLAGKAETTYSQPDENAVGSVVADEWHERLVPILDIDRNYHERLFIGDSVEKLFL